MTVRSMRSMACGALVLLALGCREPTKYPWMIVPGVRIGPVSAQVSERELIDRFGPEAQPIPVTAGEGDVRPGIVLFPRDSRRIEIAWLDSVAHRGIKTVRIEGRSSAWRLEGRVQLGTDLYELERLNGGPFTMAGFGWIDEGVVLSWEEGALTSAMKGVYLYLLPERGRIGSDPYRRRMGNQAFSSDDGDLRALDPRVARIVVAFDIEAPR